MDAYKNFDIFHMKTSYIFQGALGNQITIQSWYMNGLLRDTLSTDNGIILTTAERWVLMIDPQV